MPRRSDGERSSAQGARVTSASMCRATAPGCVARGQGARPSSQITELKRCRIHLPLFQALAGEDGRWTPAP